MDFLDLITFFINFIKYTKLLYFVFFVYFVHTFDCCFRRVCDSVVIYIQLVVKLARSGDG